MLRCLTASLCVLCVLCGAAPAAAPPTVESVSPGAGRRGTEFTLTLAGARLTGPQELMLYSPGVVCTKVEGTSENEVVATLRAAADCRLGLHAFRLRTAGGASEVRTFRVTSFPVVPEADAHGDREHAQVVPLNTTVAAVLDAGDTDFYAVALKKGQRLSAEVEGVRLGVEPTDTVLTAYGPDGKQLAFADDTPLFRQDPFVSLVAPVDGTYAVEVRDANRGGGDNHRYLLHVGTFPRPAAVFPAGGQAGTEVAVKLFDAAGDRDAKVTLPASGTPFEFYPGDADGTAPTPNPFRVSPFPNVTESEPNDAPAATKAAAAWPVAFNGIIEKAGDVDHFRFLAKKGDVIDVQAFAYRIGSPVDTVVAVFTAGGTLVAQNDDDETHDSRVLVVVPADGEYLVRVTDKRKQGGPAFIYRVELDRPQPGLTVFLPERVRKSQDRHVIAVPRGGRVTAFLGVRRDRVDGPVALACGELPAGVKVGLGTVAAGEYLLPVVFEAAADAPLGGKLVPFAGTGGDATRAVTGGFAQELVLVRGPGDSGMHAVTLDALAVVVIDRSPLEVTLLPPAGPLAADGTLDVTVRVTRAKDFAEPVAVSFPCLPPGVEVPTTVTIPADKSEAVVTLVASPAADLGEWKLVAEAEVARPGRGDRDPLVVGMNGLGTPDAPPAGRGRRRKAIEGFTPVASEMRAVTLAAPPVKGAFAPAVAEQGKAVKVVLALEGPVPAGTFTARLDGLPPRAAAQPVEVRVGAKQVEFAVTVDATTPVGAHDALVCELAGTVGGQKVVYRVGRGGVLKVDAPGAVKTDAAGKPLSPLDALRQQEKSK
ncbi:pre-peptidase C-terminal domain-containing protein [Gemmata sp.]|uniref:pre-peptidase C-terminal domain-containing protein n=1 Tax=Gemmata sp. TaxID=1914242 RepID=UPI003F6FF7CF